MSRQYDRCDPFIIAQKARQVYYVPYPKMRTDKCGWCVAIKTKPRSRTEVDDLDDDVPFQDEEMSCVQEITEVEQLTSLRDETHSYEEADPINVSLLPNVEHENEEEDLMEDSDEAEYDSDDDVDDWEDEDGEDEDVD